MASGIFYRNFACTWRTHRKLYCGICSMHSHQIDQDPSLKFFTFHISNIQNASEGRSRSERRNFVRLLDVDHTIDLLNMQQSHCSRRNPCKRSIDHVSLATSVDGFTFHIRISSNVKKHCCSCCPAVFFCFSRAPALIAVLTLPAHCEDKGLVLAFYPRLSFTKTEDTSSFLESLRFILS